MSTRLFASLRALLVSVSFLALLAGCSGSKSTGSTGSTTSISGYPNTPQTVSPGQGLVLAATVTNDVKSAGVTWALTGPGSLSNGTNSGPSVTTINTITYTAAATPSAVTTATVTATSVAVPSLSVTFTINLEQQLVITTASPLPSASLNAAYSASLATTGGTAPVNFQVLSGALPAGLTLSTSGVLSGVPTVTGTYSFTVEATDSSASTLTATKTFALSVIGPLTITSGNMATGEIGLPFRFLQTATGGTPPYTWTVTQGSLPTGVTLSAATGTLSGMPTGAAGTASLTSAVTDSAGMSVSHNVTITLSAARTSTNNGELKGQYAFVLSGFDVAGNPLAAAGKFTADGAGNITSGVMDSNGTAMTAAQTNVALTATTYSVGADGRGKVVLSSASGSLTFVIALGSVSAGVATHGSMLEFDTTGAQLTGSLALQDTTSFSTSAITGGYAFGLQGFLGSASGHAGAVGEIQLKMGALTSGEILASTRGAAPLTLTAGTYTLAATGRGTLTLTLPGSLGTVNFAIYPVSAKMFYLVSTDASSAVAPVLLGEASAQTIANGNFSLTSLNGTAVESQSRSSYVSSSASVAAQASVGLFSFDGKGDATLQSDSNSAGTVTSTTAAAPSTASYTVAMNGRATITSATGIGGCEDCATPRIIAYLYGANAGYTLDYLTGAGTGSFVAQTQNSFASASFNGIYVSGTVKPPAVTSASSGVLNANGSGAASGVFDVNSQAALAPDTAITYTTTVAANGRVALAGSDGSSRVLYLISPTAGVLLNLTTSTPALQALQQ